MAGTGQQGTPEERHSIMKRHTDTNSSADQIVYLKGILTLLRDEAAVPTLTTNGFRNYVFKMCDLALRKKECV
jgi:hypothetical protein